jgi:hypothetical protein
MSRKIIKFNGTGLEQLFGSKTRFKLLKLFLNNPNRIYYIREIVRELGIQLNAVRHELKNLKNFGLIHEISAEQKIKQGLKSEMTNVKRSKVVVNTKNKNAFKKYFQVNTDFALYPELKSLLLKSQLLFEEKIIKAITKLGTPHYFILTGFFVNQENSPTDILIVGKINRKKLKSLIKSFEKDLGRTINYTAMSRKEFKYRKDITDRFLYNILEGKKIVVIDRLNEI